MKKDTAKTKTNKATIQALHKSIAHWNDICYGMEDNHMGYNGNCALCKKFSGCEGCPVDADGRNCNNTNSQWSNYHYADKIKTDGRRGFCTVDSADAAEAMLELLVSLLPEREQWQYSPRMYVGMFHPESWIVDIDIHTHTGITTDGRNAFPQAKKVWEKVFEYQVCGPIPEMPSYEWAECPTKWWLPIYGSGSIKTKDGKCVTCGQVVKKKEVRYQVLYRSTCGDKGLGVSTEHYTNAGEFYSNTSGLTYIKMLSESAKEFDV